MGRRSRRLAVAALLLVLVVAAAGCGGSGTSSTSTSTTAPVKAAPGSEEAGQEGAAGDGSITGYGGAAKGGEKAAVVGAVHGFLTAMAAQDYARLCADLSGANRKQLESFSGAAGGGCPAALKKLLNPAVAKEARAAAAAPVTSVRIKDGTAFALFKPQGGSASYLVMKREGGSWRSIAVTPGTPLEAAASP